LCPIIKSIFIFFLWLYLTTLASSFNNVTVQILKPLFYETESNLRTILVSLDSNPRDRLSVILVSSDSLSTIVPNRLMYTMSDNVDKPKEIAFKADNPGITTISILLEGSSAIDYRVNFITDNIITILSKNVEPPKPIVNIALFNNNGESIFIIFNSKTNQANFENIFPCEYLLEFYGNIQSTCQWINSTHIEILGAKMISPGTSITIKGDKILPYCEYITCLSNFVELTTIYISPPIDPIIPSVSISTPNIIGGCNSIILDLTSSTGFCGRPWKQIYFKVESEDSISASIIEDFLNHNYIFSPPSSIDNSMLIKGHNYTFTVNMCNFFHICGSSSYTVSVLPSVDIPTAIINGEQKRYILSTDSILLTSKAYTTTCENNEITTTTLGLIYSWNVFLNGINQNIISESKDPSKFKLSPNRLLYNNTYDIHLHVINSAHKQIIVSTIIKVLKPPLSVAIRGNTQKTIIVGDTIQILSIASQDNVIYNWECLQIAPVISSCFLNNQINTNTNNLYATDSAVNTVNRVTITVYDEITKEFASSYTDISVIAGDAPQVNIISSLHELTSLDTSKNIKINGYVFLKHGKCNATWTMNGKPLNPNNILTPPYVTVTSEILTGRKLSLVMSPNVLTPRSSYVFELNCKNSISSILLTTNGAPLPGIFVISPLSGVELETLFTFSANQWTDDNLPLTYMFGFVSNGKNMIIQGRSELSYSKTMLSSGHESNMYNVNCIIMVYDTLDAFTQDNINVKVTKSTSANIQSNIVKQLDTLSSNTDAIKQTLSIVSTAMNYVNCSGVSNCKLLNREECSKISFTCGDCLPDYIGDNGHKNSLCISSFDSFPDISKQCTNNCSNNGICKFINTHTGIFLDDCKLGDINCETQCECDIEYSGEICDTLLIDMESKQDIRGSLVNHLLGLTQNEDASIDTISTWSSSLDSLTQNPYEINFESVNNINNIVDNIINSAISTSISYKDINHILSICDSSTKALNNNINNRRKLTTTEINILDDNIMTTTKLLGKYGNMVSNQMYEGQDSFNHILDSFRLSTSIIENNKAINTPLTQSEIKSGVIPSSVYIPSILNEEPIKATTVTTKKKIFGMPGDNITTDSLHLELSGISSNTEFTIVLQNNEEVGFITKNSSYVLFMKCNEGEIASHEKICPDSGFKINFICQGWEDYMNATCPSQTQQPVCNLFNTENSNIMCHMSSYTSTNTTCNCIFYTNTTVDNRRLDTLDDTGITDLVIISKFVTNQFLGTMSYPPVFTSWEDIKKVMIVLLMYSILWSSSMGIILLCIIKRWASRDKDYEKQQYMIKQIELAGKLRSPLAIQKYLYEYVNSVIPIVFHDKPFFTRMWSELKQNHRYINLLTTSGKDNDKTRITTGIQLLTTQTLLMFLIAFFYDLEGPNDDGTCSLYNDKTQCLSRVSILDHTQSYCQFNIETDICSYKEPEFSWKSIVIIGVLTVFITCLFTSPLDWLFDFIFAPVKMSTSSKVYIDNDIDSFKSKSSLLFDRIKRMLFSYRYTNDIELREVPYNTESSYMMAKSSIEVVKNINNDNKQYRNKLISQLKEQISDENIFETIEEPYDNNTIINHNSTLFDDINLQRRILMMNDLNIFDDKWGIDPTGSFIKKTKYHYITCKNETIDVENILKQELELVDTESKMKIEKFKNINEKYIGLELLHIFILDLLGRDTNASKIFITKSNVDYKYTKAVSAKVKGVSWLCVLMMNMFFVYYSTMRGMIRGKTWQYAYLSACISQTIFEIFIAETFEVIWVHFIIPNIVAKDVKKVWYSIMNTIQNLVQMTANNSVHILDATEHLFVSKKIANVLPELPESIIISSYHNHLPGQLGMKWEIDRKSLMGLSGTSVWMRFLTFNTLLTILKFLGTSPFVIQRTIIRVSSPIFTMIVVFVWLYILQNPLYLSIISVCSIIYMYCYCKQNTNKVLTNTKDNSHVDIEMSNIINIEP